MLARTSTFCLELPFLKPRVPRVVNRGPCAAGTRFRRAPLQKAGRGGEKRWSPHGGACAAGPARTEPHLSATAGRGGKERVLGELPRSLVYKHLCCLLVGPRIRSTIKMCARSM